MTPPDERTTLAWAAYLTLAIALGEVLLVKLGGLLKVAIEQAGLVLHAFGS
jgi:hypothetical protein